MLRIVNLSVEVDGRRILQNINLYIKKGETVALFGPNGSGKSTLLNAIVGNPTYKIAGGRIIFKKVDITNMPTDQRVKLGLGMSFQHPPKISGVKLIDILRHCAKLSGMGEEKIFEFAEKLRMKEHLSRSVNLGFSGGEVKRSEILQLLLMNPDFVLLDEPDSGVDLENIAIVGSAISELLQREREDRDKGGLIITHQGHILDYVSADYGVILYKGRVACVGDPKDIIAQIRKNGYEGCVARCLKDME